MLSFASIPCPITNRTQLCLLIQYGKLSSRSGEMRSVFAKTADGVYIVQTKSRFRIRTKWEEIAEFDMDDGLIEQWRVWSIAEVNSTSINDERVKEYRNKQVDMAFSLSSKEPEGWTDTMTSFVQESDPDSESLRSLIRRFGNRFPRMRGLVGSGWFEHIRQDCREVYLIGEELWE